MEKVDRAYLPGIKLVMIKQWWGICFPKTVEFFLNVTDLNIFVLTLQKTKTNFQKLITYHSGLK